MNTLTDLLTPARHMPLVAILRGLLPTQAQAVGEALVEAGFHMLEVPLNRPGALECIATLARTLPADAVVGGGTMFTVADVDAVHAAGGRLLVSPNYDADVIRRAVHLGMLSAPGVATPTEAFAALRAGAHALKLYPADMLGHGGLKALKSVLPADTELWPVGGVSPDNMGAWIRAGATGFGIGGQLFTPGMSAADVREKARGYVRAWQQAQAPITGPQT